MTVVVSVCISLNLAKKAGFPQGSILLGRRESARSEFGKSNKKQHSKLPLVCSAFEEHGGEWNPNCPSAGQLVGKIVVYTWDLGQHFVAGSLSLFHAFAGYGQ